MTRFALPVLLAALLLAPIAGAAPWAQVSHDAARTGSSPDPGPATNDTAFVTRLPGAPPKAILGPPEPLILDGYAYVPVEPTPFDDGIDGQGVARVNLDTAETELFVEMNRTPQYLASGDGKIFVQRNRGVDAYDARTGERVWSEPHPDLLTEGGQTFCVSPAVLEGQVVMACTELDTPAQQGDLSSPPETLPFAWAVNATDGEFQWLYGLDPLNQDTAEEEASSTTEEPQDALTPSRAGQQRFAAGVSVVGPVVVVGVANAVDVEECEGVDDAGVCTNNEEFHVRLWAIDRDSPHVLWTNRSSPTRDVDVYTSVENRSRSVVDDPALPLGARVTGTDRIVYAKIDSRVEARSATDGELLWSEPLGEEDLEGNVGGMSSALDGDRLYATSAETLHRIDVDVESKRWQFALDPALGEEFDWGSVIVAEDTVYAMTRGPFYAYSAIYAVDAETGEQVWRYRLDLIDPRYENYDNCCFTAFSYALGDGVVVGVGSDATVHVIGETEASIEPNVEASTDIPAPGEEATIDLSGTEPGAFGPATRYRVDWGDGNTTGWTSNSTLSHAYAEDGERTAVIQAANDANQTATTTYTFDVGATEPTWLSERFQPENQDMTFGVLGIAVAMTGGAIGVARRYRERSRLQDELEAVEQAYEQTKHRPAECEAQLTERKTHARGLMLDGELKEEQFRIVENRIEELKRELRLGAVEDEFDFLPYGLIKKAREMLEDGRVTSLEKEAFLAALETDEVLTEDQRSIVRERIENWFARDAGGGSSA